MENNKDQVVDNDQNKALAEASMSSDASPDETFWQRLMREFNEFIWPEEKP